MLACWVAVLGWSHPVDNQCCCTGPCGSYDCKMPSAITIRKLWTKKKFITHRFWKAHGIPGSYLVIEGRERGCGPGVLLSLGSRVEALGFVAYFSLVNWNLTCGNLKFRERKSGPNDGQLNWRRSGKELPPAPNVSLALGSLAAVCLFETVISEVDTSLKWMLCNQSLSPALTLQKRKNLTIGDCTTSHP